MKKVLLDKNLSYYKANLHCHTVISDGQRTPEEIKKMYMDHGYSIVAYTDHDVLLDHSDLTDDHFVAMNGFEVEIGEPGQGRPHEGRLVRTCHLCLVALEPDNLTQVCYHRSRYLFANAPQYRDQIRFDESKPDFVREYTPDCINTIIAEGRKNGFFVTYNHPGWSLERYPEYMAYHGMNAMEIVNYGCVESGYVEHNEREYEDMLIGGEKIFCIAADDNHNGRQDSFGGFTVINAEKLEYRTVAAALQAGKCYASEGPQIHSLVYEDGFMHLECSPAVSVRLNTANRRTAVVHQKDASGVTAVSFKVEESDRFVRLTVTDASGKNAYTNAYFLEDLEK